MLIPRSLIIIWDKQYISLYCISLIFWKTLIVINYSLCNPLKLTLSLKALQSLSLNLMTFTFNLFEVIFTIGTIIQAEG